MRMTYGWSVGPGRTCGPDQVVVGDPTIAGAQRHLGSTWTFGPGPAPGTGSPARTAPT